MDSWIDRIKTLMKEGESQEQFAHRFGITTKTVNQWLNGKATPSPMAKDRIKQMENGRQK